MNPELVTGNIPCGLAAVEARPPALFLPSEKAAGRFLEFFTANIRNKNTRRAYYKAAGRLSDWCEGRRLFDLAQVKPQHVAAYIEILGLPEPQGQGLSKPSLKQHLCLYPRTLPLTRAPYTNQASVCGFGSPWPSRSSQPI